MTSSTNHPISQTHQTSARQGVHGGVDRSTPRFHRRVDSIEVNGVGDHLRPPTTQKSWPRPEHIDIPGEESTSTISNTEHPGEGHRRPPGHAQGMTDDTQLVPSIPSPPAPTKDKHCMSSEAAASLISQRDALRDHVAKNGVYSHLILANPPPNAVRFGKSLLSCAPHPPIIFIGLPSGPHETHHISNLNLFDARSQLTSHSSAQ